MYLEKFNKYLYNIILENNKLDKLPFVLSNRLFEILENINHPIARKIIELGSEKEDNKVTFIDIDTDDYSPNDDKDTIFKRFTLINSNKGYENIKNLHPDISNDKMISIIKTTMFTNNTAINTEWWKKNRTPIKIGSFIRKLFGEKFKDAGDTGNDITSFVNMFYAKRKSIEEGNGGFELVKGQDIIEWYNEDNYSPGGPLNSSCMRYDKCSKYIKFYASNPETVSLLILKDPLDSGMIIGRAIIWKLIEPEGRYFMDRIYYTSDNLIELFKDYAYENEWLYKKNQNMNEDEYIVDPKSDSSSHITLVSEMSDNSEYFPYMDTMKYFLSGERIITNSRDYINDEYHGEEYYILTNTDGGYDVQNYGIYVEFYDDYFDEDDLRYCEYGDEYRLHEDAVELSRRYHYEYATKEYIEENMKWSDYHDEYLMDDDAVWSEFDEDYIHIDHIIQVYKSADYDTFDDAIDDDDNVDERCDSNDMISYYRDSKYYYFDEFDNEKYFIYVKTNNGNAYKHKIWDKNNFIEKNGEMYFFDNQKDHDTLIGQLRLFDSRNYKSKI